MRASAAAMREGEAEGTGKDKQGKRTRQRCKVRGVCDMTMKKKPGLSTCTTTFKKHRLRVDELLVQSQDPVIGLLPPAGWWASRVRHLKKVPTSCRLEGQPFKAP